MMSYDNLQRIKWSRESLKLKEFIMKYKLPQIVCVKDGYYGSSKYDTFSSGEKLKLHSVASELRAVCYKGNEICYQIPIKTQEIVELNDIKSSYCKTVADVAKLTPLPKFFEVQSGYFALVGVDEKGVYIESKEKLEVLCEKPTTLKDNNGKFLTCRSNNGEIINLPFNCEAGFKPVYSGQTYHLNQILSNQAITLEQPVHFKFTNPQCSHYKLGILKCSEVCNINFVIASSEQDSSSNVFSIPLEIEITVTVAEGANRFDNDYENIRINYHNFVGIEDEVKISRSSHIFRSSLEVHGLLHRKLKRKPSHSKKRPTTAKGQKDTVPLNVGEKAVQLSHNQGENYYSRIDQSITLDSIKSDAQINTNVTVNRDVLNPVVLDSGTSAEIRSCEKEISEEVCEIKRMSIRELCGVLKELRLERHVETFKENLIDGELLCTLEDEELKDIGLNNFEIKKLVKYENGWRPKM